MQKKLATYVLLFFGSGYRSMPGEGHTVVFGYTPLSDSMDVLPGRTENPEQQD